MINLSKHTSTYTFSPYNPPAIWVDPGTTIRFETMDALNEQIGPEADNDSARTIDLDHVNAATGPVFINGAKPGDTLVAEILDIQLAEIGSALIIPGFGFLQDSLPGPYTRVFYREKDGTYKFGESISIKPKPMIGTIGVAPMQAITTLSSGIHGGNLDTTDICQGSKVYLPVLVDGALFGVGDVHAAMGDGEVCGTGIECGAVLTIRLDLIANHPIPRPRIETTSEWMCVASAEGLENAIKLALQDTVEWLQVEHHMKAEEAYVLTSLVGDVRIGQVVDPMVTVRVAVPKAVFVK
jgi:amidase